MLILFRSQPINIAIIISARYNMEGRLRIIIGVVVLISGLSGALVTLPESAHPFYDIHWLEYADREGKTILVADTNEISLWDVDSGSLLGYRYVRGRISEMDVSSNGIVAVGTEKGKILLLDNRTLELKDQYSFNSAVSTLAWSTGSNRLAAGLTDGSILVWEGETEVLNTSFTGEWICGVSLSPTGDTMAVCYENEGLYVVDVGDPGTSLLRDANGPTDCSFSPFGDLAVSYLSGHVVVYDHLSWNMSFSGWVDRAYNVVDWSWDGTRLYASGGMLGIRIWDMPSGAMVSERRHENNPASHLAAGNETVAVSTRYFVYIYTLDGEEISHFPVYEEAPFLLPITIICSIIFTILTIECELARRRFWKSTQAIYIEHKVPLDEKLLLMLLGIFVFNAVFMHLDVGVGRGGFAVWNIILIGGTFGFIIIIMLIIQTRQVVIEEDGITLSTSFYEARFKKKPVRLGLSDITKVHPDYFFNRNEKDLKKVGFELVSVDGQVGTILLVGPSAASTDDVKDALAKAFGSRWEQIYTEEPYIDEVRWKKIGHYSKKSYASVSMKFAALLFIPYFFILFLILSVPALSFGLYLLFSMGSMAILILGMIFGLKRMRKWVEASTIKARMELLDYMRKRAPISTFEETKEKTVFEPDKHLRMTEREWRDVERRIAQGRPLAYVMTASAVFFIIAFLGARAIESLILLIPATLSFAVLMISVFYSMRITQAYALVKKAAEHELRTGEQVLPENFNIPKSWFLYISREPIELTEEEKAFAQRIKDQGEMLIAKQMIVMMVAMFLPMIIFFTLDPFGGTWYRLYVFMAGIMGPVLVFMFYSMSRQRIAQKVKQAEEIDRLLKERKESEHKKE